MNLPTTDLSPVSTEPEPTTDLTKSLLVLPTNTLPSLSPPLITPEETPAIQEKKQEFTRQLLSKSLHRESNNLPIAEKTTNPLTLAHKTVVMKPVVVPRAQKQTVDNRRVSSVERHPVAAPIRNKLPASGSSTCLNANNQQRLAKIPIDIFQPQSKCNTTACVSTKKPTITTTKTKISPKTNVPKVRISTVVPDEEPIQSNK